MISSMETCSSLMQRCLGICLAASLLALCPTARAAEEVDYLRDIKPVLKSKCYSCHGPIKQEADLRLDTVDLAEEGGDSGPAINLKSPLESLLLQRISATDEAERMPPEGEPLSVEQIDRVRNWLRMGASRPSQETPQSNPQSHWAFQPLPAFNENESRSIDSFIQNKLATVEIPHAPPAAPRELVRRMFLDLHGLPPTPEQVMNWAGKIAAAREEADGQQEKRVLGDLIDMLLANRHYGERWAQHWLDLVRYADTHGFEVNTPRPNAWPYRDYVIRALNEDTPYDQFIREQIVGDAEGEDAATGFLVAAAALLPGQIGKDEASKRLARQDSLDEIVVATGATFLGLTVGCARCHDHKFDPIPQSDYYALQAFFAGVDYGERPLRGANDTSRQKQAKELQSVIAKLQNELRKLEPQAFTGRTIVIDDEDLNRVTLLAKKNGHGQNPAGSQRGYLDDAGGPDRIGNLSRGRYTWWPNTPGKDVLSYNPEVKGDFRIWLSWGVHGSGVHTRDARYLLDLDGDLSSHDDQKEIARADQYYFVGVSSGESEKKPLWSGLHDAGVHELTANSKVVLRGGDTQTGITADVIVLQEQAATRGPHLRAPVSPLLNVESFAPVMARYVRFTSRSTNENDRYEPCLDELEVYTADGAEMNVGAASAGASATSSGNYSNSGKHQLKHINDGRYGNSFSWISNQKGRGWVQLKLAKPERIHRIEWARDREGKFKDRLPLDYLIEGSLDGKSWQPLASSSDRVAQGTPFDPIHSLLAKQKGATGDALRAKSERLQALKSQRAELLKPQLVFAGNFRKPDRSFILSRGDPEQPLEEIQPHTLSILKPVAPAPGASEQQRRIDLANWIASKNNPLTARVIANRIWQFHFGVGIVDTPSDFGMNGSVPTHPELLDWLATQLIASKWSLKHLHRLIMSSQTYQQSSVWRPVGNSKRDPYVVDADCRLLWRFPTRRLEAEAIRDCILHVSGQLNLEAGGPGFDFFKSRGGLSGFPPLEEFESKHLRRMVYAHKIRMERVPVFGAFDCPDAGLPSPRRSQSTTAIQALNLFNSTFILDQADAFSRRVESERGDAKTRITRAFELALGRTPTQKEQSAAKEVLQKHGLATVCRALFNCSEFLYIP